MQSGACICCGSEHHQPHLSGLRRCPNCTHIWADLSIPDDELKRLYSRGYFQGEEYVDYQIEERALRRNFRRRLGELRRFIPPPARLWEIGSAYGFFLKEASALYEVAGCDVSDHAAQQAAQRAGVAVAHGDYLDIPAPPRPRDIICLWDTLEHLRDPRATLAKAHDELRPGGILAISTGDAGSWVAKRRGSRWRLIHPPTHLHYFTVRSLQTLLENLGFRLRQVNHPLFWRSAESAAFRVLRADRSTGGSLVFRSLKATRLLGLSFPLNTGDLMTVYAERLE